MIRACKPKCFFSNKLFRQIGFSTKAVENVIRPEETQHQSDHVHERRNAFGIPLISESLEKVIFGDEIHDQKKKLVKDSGRVNEALTHLKSFGLRPNFKSDKATPKLSFELPGLYGDVESHFFRIGQKYIEPYIQLVESYLSSKGQVPKIPPKWEFRSGWTRYDPVDGSTSVVHCPLEDVFCFDVETCVKDGPNPVMATALTSVAWYSWCSESLINTNKQVGEQLLQSDLIPLLTPGVDPKPRLVIGHNVCYDRARTSEEYDIAQTRTRFMDTMSLHIVVNGMTSGQRMQKQMKTEVKLNIGENSNGIEDMEKPKWLNETSMNNLNDVYQLYCKKGPLMKQKRDVFVVGSMDEIRNDFHSLMTYCSNDVRATFEVFQHVYPLFRSRCPHPVTLAGMLEMGSAYLPINFANWSHYVRQADFAAEELEEEIERVLAQQAKETCQMLVEGKYQEDLWMWDQDWKCSKLKMKKGKGYVNSSSKLGSELENLEAKFEGILQTANLLYKKQPKVPGYPGWFSDICEQDSKGFSDPTDLGLSKSVVPKLLRLNWMGYPLHRHKDEKWGFFVPKESMWDEGDAISDQGTFPLKSLEKYLQQKGTSGKNISKEDDSSILVNDFVHEPPDRSGFKKNGKSKVEGEELSIELPEAPGCHFFKLPHKDGKELRVGNPLSKSFFGKVRDGVLSTESGHLAEKVLRAGKMLSYWKSNRERVCNQMVVSLSDSGSNPIPGASAIIPQLVPAGTLTRRAVERTWLTASNAKVDRVGSELKCMVQAPSGYCLVGADVDSQELWIAAIFGDSQFVGEHGCTALGWMTLQGTKAAGTDMHSVTAKSVGVSRDEAKILNYGRIYGAGIPFAKQLLRTFNPSLSENEASRLAAKMYAETKGERMYQLNKLGAICRAITLSANGEDINPIDLVGKVISRKQMNILLKIKLKLEAYVLKANIGAKKSEFMLNEVGLNIAYELDNISFDPSKSLTLAELASFLKAIGSTQFTAEQNDNWKENLNAMSSKSVWTGGTESHTFNRLEEIASDWHAKTPVLGCQISRVLEAEMVGSDYLPSRINWVVQSSAVDYLHLLLVSMDWLTKVYDIDARFVISIHDEVRYLVKSEDRYRAGLALQISNLLVRAMFCKRLGLNSLPKDVAFFSGVDVDRVMRKDPESECITPSNPQGLTHGYGIQLGECLTMQDIIEKTGGTLEKKNV